MRVGDVVWTRCVVYQAFFLHSCSDISDLMTPKLEIVILA